MGRRTGGRSGRGELRMLAVAPAAAALALAPAATALPHDPAALGAQADPQMDTLMAPAIEPSSVGLYAAMMGLDGDQAEAARALYAGYLAAYREAATASRDTTERLFAALYGEDAQRAADPEVAAKMVDALGVLLERRLALGRLYLDDLAALASTDAQRAGHDRVVRAYERELAMDLVGLERGVRPVDLVVLGQRFSEMAPRALGAEASAALLDYEAELAGPCGRIAELGVDLARRRLAAMADAGTNASARAAALERDGRRLRAMAREVRAANDRFADRVEAALPADARTPWRRAYEAATYPQVHAPGAFERVRAAALALPTLDDAQRAGIESARLQFEREAVEPNRRWAAAIDESQRAIDEWTDQETTDEHVRRWERLNDLERRAADAQETRRALDARFARRILDLLTPEQRERMPAGSGVDADAVIRDMGGG